MGRLVLTKGQDGKLHGLDPKGQRAWDRFKAKLKSLDFGDTLGFTFFLPRDPVSHRSFFRKLQVLLERTEAFTELDTLRAWLLLQGRRELVAETLHDIVDPLVFAEAANLIADHKLCGRDVVVVSASGEEIVAPIARELGANHSMATRMVVADGKYTGDVDFYCFAEGKVQAIEELAAREGYALEHCYAYSDSITDLPMLAAVGHPAVVNPDRALRKEAVARGWPVLTFTRPVSLRDRLPAAPSGAAVATTLAVGASALAAGAVTYSLLRRLSF